MISNGDELHVRTSADHMPMMAMIACSRSDVPSTINGTSLTQIARSDGAGFPDPSSGDSILTARVARMLELYDMMSRIAITMLHIVPFGLKNPLAAEISLRLVLNFSRLSDASAARSVMLWTNPVASVHSATSRLRLREIPSRCHWCLNESTMTPDDIAFFERKIWAPPAIQAAPNTTVTTIPSRAIRRDMSERSKNSGPAIGFCSHVMASKSVGVYLVLPENNEVVNEAPSEKFWNDGTEASMSSARGEIKTEGVCGEDEGWENHLA